MRQFLFGLLLSIGFIAGSVASQLNHHVVPAAQASAPAPVQRWEYVCQNDIHRPWKAEDLDKLNAFGRDGWELVQQLVGANGSNYDVFCFKRPLVLAAPLPPPKPCLPACAANLFCEEGKCVEACQPSCGESQYCATDRRCYWIRNGRRTADPVVGR